MCGLNWSGASVFKFWAGILNPLKPWSKATSGHHCYDYCKSILDDIIFFFLWCFFLTLIYEEMHIWCPNRILRKLAQFLHEIYHNNKADGSTPKLEDTNGCWLLWVTPVEIQGITINHDHFDKRTPFSNLVQKNWIIGQDENRACFPFLLGYFQIWPCVVL